MRKFSTKDFDWYPESKSWRPKVTVSMCDADAEVELVRTYGPKPEGSQIESLNALIACREAVEVDLAHSLAAYRSTVSQSMDERIPGALSSSELWKSFGLDQIIVPPHHGTSDRHIFLHFSFDLDPEHGAEAHIVNERVERSGAIECPWQCEGWLESARLSIEPVSRIIPATSLALPLPEDWIDDTNSYLPYVESWRNVTFIKKLLAPAEDSSASSEAAIVVIVGELPEGLTVDEYRTNLSVSHTQRNEEVSFSGYPAYVLEGPISKVLLSPTDEKVVVYQLRLTSNAAHKRYASLWRALP